MLWTRLSPPMLEIVTSKADRAVMAVTIERDCPVCLGFVGLPRRRKILHGIVKGCARGSRPRAWCSSAEQTVSERAAHSAVASERLAVGHR